MLQINTAYAILNTNQLLSVYLPNLLSTFACAILGTLVALAINRVIVNRQKKNVTQAEVSNALAIIRNSISETMRKVGRINAALETEDQCISDSSIDYSTWEALKGVIYNSSLDLSLRTELSTFFHQLKTFVYENERLFNSYEHSRGDIPTPFHTALRDSLLVNSGNIIGTCIHLMLRLDSLE